MGPVGDFLERYDWMSRLTDENGTKFEYFGSCNKKTWFTMGLASWLTKLFGRV